MMNFIDGDELLTLCEKENKKILTQAFRMLLKIPTKKQL